MNPTPHLIAAYSIVDRLGNRAHYAASLNLETRRVTAYVCNGVPALPRYLECDRWQAEALEQIAMYSGVGLPPRALNLDAPDFDPEPGVGNAIGSQLHRLMGAGIRDHYGYATKVLEQTVTSFAALTADEVNAVGDAIYSSENAALEQSVTLTNPAFRQGFRVSLDPTPSRLNRKTRST